MRIGFFGDGPWAHSALDQIIAKDSIEVSFVCARTGTSDNHLERRAKEIGVPFLRPKDVNDPAFIQQVTLERIELIVSMSYDQIFKREILDVPILGAINCHAGKLPDYRGRNVLNWVLINDETEFGVTVHFIDDGIDSGDIILQETALISDADDYGSLLDKAYEMCPRLLLDALGLIETQSYVRKPQLGSSRGPIICSRRVAGDEVIDWRQTSREIFNFVRSLSHPGPGAGTSLRGSDVKVFQARFLDDAPHYIGIPGTVLDKRGEVLLVKTLDSYLELNRVESPARIRVGDRFE